MRYLPLSWLSMGVQSGFSAGSGSCLAPNECINSCTRLSTAILSGMRDCCWLRMLTNRALKLYV